MLPNSASQQRVGVDPIQNQQQNNANQKLAEILDSFQSRLDNVLNVRTEVQSATFSAFGNNMLTRGMTQLTDSITDSIKGLFSKPEDPKEDPVLAQLKIQTATLQNLADSNNQSSSAVVNALEDGFTSLRIDQKQHRSSMKDESEHQVDLLSDILRALEDMSTMPQQPNASARERDQRRMYDDIIDAEDVTPTSESNVPRIGTDVVEVTSPSDRPVDQKEEKFYKDQADGSSKTLKTLNEINDKLSKLVGTIEISTQESDAEALRSMQDRNVISDVNEGDRAPKSESFIERLFKGLGDFDANKLGFMKIFTKVFGALAKVIGPVITLIGTLASSAIPKLIKGLGSIISAVGNVASKIPGLLSTIAKGAASLASKVPVAAIGKGIAQGAATVGRGLLAAAPMVGSALAVGAAGAAGYYAGTKLNEAMEGTAVGNAKDAAFDWLFSKVDQVTGGAISGNPNGLDIPDPVVPQKDVTSEATLRVIEENQKAALEKDRVKSDKPASVVVQDNSVKTQQTIMPARANVMNVDASYNRYMDTSFLATGRR